MRGRSLNSFLLDFKIYNYWIVTMYLFCFGIYDYTKHLSCFKGETLRYRGSKEPAVGAEYLGTELETWAVSVSGVCSWTLWIGFMLEKTIKTWFSGLSVYHGFSHHIYVLGSKREDTMSRKLWCESCTYLQEQGRIAPREHVLISMVQIIELLWSSNCQTDVTKWVWTEWTPNSFMTSKSRQ